MASSSTVVPSRQQYLAIDRFVKGLISGPIFILYYKSLDGCSQACEKQGALLTFCQNSAQRAISAGTIAEIPSTVTIGDLRSGITTLIEQLRRNEEFIQKCERDVERQGLDVRECGEHFVNVAKDWGSITAGPAGDTDPENPLDTSANAPSRMTPPTGSSEKTQIFYQQRDMSHLAPRRTPWKDGQANPRRLAHRLNPELYESIVKNVAPGSGIVKWNKAMELMEKVLGEAEWSRYQEIAGKVNSGKLESTNVDRGTMLKRAARYLDGSLGTLDVRYDVQALVLLSWKNEEGTPTVGVQHTPNFLGNLKGYKKFQTKVTELFIDLLESEDIDVVEHDSDSPGTISTQPPKLPQPRPDNKRDIVKLMTKYLLDVAEWQGGGLKSKRSVPWSKLGSEPRGTILTAASVPENVTLGQTNIVQGDVWNLWYDYLVRRENDGHVPAVEWVTEALKKPEQQRSGKTVFDPVGLWSGSDDDDVEWSRKLDQLQPFLEDSNGDTSSDKTREQDPVPIDPQLASQSAGIMPTVLAPYIPTQHLPITVSNEDSNGDTSSDKTREQDPVPIDPQLASQSAGIMPTVLAPYIPTQNLPITVSNENGVAAESAQRPSIPVSENEAAEHHAHVFSLPPMPEPPTLMGRRGKTGRPVRSPNNGASSKAKAAIRKRAAIEARDTGGDDETRVSRKRTRREPEAYATSNRIAIVKWSFAGLLWALDLDAGGAKDIADQVPTSLRADFKDVVKKFLTVDNAVCARYGRMPDSAFKAAEPEGLPPLILRWVRHFNNNLASPSPFPVDEDVMGEANIRVLEEWLLGLPLANLDSVPDENLLDTPWFRPLGQGLSHVIWAFSIWARSFDSKIKRFDVPESFGLLVSRLHKLLQRLQVSKKRTEENPVFRTLQSSGSSNANLFPQQPM
ncbi:hypothetical protein VKT23_013408 [Stygiomarasmius scandens]|uniref:Uncharacterized protein n=1 Tax=Marasmiellus scandens TaxID=2682957 RepID=A0ABR1J8M4_9AGAR